MTIFTNKDWKDYPDISTPITAAALEDLENRVWGDPHIYRDLVAPYDPRLAWNSDATITANQARGVRCIVPRAGTISKIAVAVGVQSGNIDVGIYDTAATTRTRLWSSGSQAAPAVGDWVEVGTPNLAVTKGQHLDLVCAADNATVSFARTVPNAQTSRASLPTGWMPSPSGGVPRLQWQIGTSFPLPSTLTEANLLDTTFGIFVIAKLT